jgi:uncharacterized protein (DUF427 family)
VTQTVAAGGQRAENAGRAYPEPIASVPELKDYVAFYEKTDIVVDGISRNRPVTTWS